MVTTLGKEPCPKCGSSDSLQVYLNVDEELDMEYITSYCWGTCKEAMGNPYTGEGQIESAKKKGKTEAERKEDLETVKSCELFIPKKKFRGIPSKEFKKWGVRKLLSEYDGVSPYGIAFPYALDGRLVGWKCRTLIGKNFFGLGRISEVDPFGMHRALKLEREVVWVTEGEFDTIALHHAMTLVGSKAEYSVVSLPKGGNEIGEYLGNLTKNFKLVALVLDDDEVGRKSEEWAVENYKDKVVVINKPNNTKDANQAVEEGLAKEMGYLALEQFEKFK